MKSLLLGAAMAALLVPPAMAQSGTATDAAMMEAPGRYLVFFPWNKASLTEDDQRVVGEAVAEFKRTGSARIDVTGFTDTSGSPAPPVSSALTIAKLSATADTAARARVMCIRPPFLLPDFSQGGLHGPRRRCPGSTGAGVGRPNPGRSQVGGHVDEQSSAVGRPLSGCRGRRAVT